MRAHAVVLLATIACATSHATKRELREQSLSPLRVADRLPDTVAYFGVDVAQAALGNPQPALVRSWTQAQRDSGARVLERAGYRVRVVSGGRARLERYTSSRFAIAGTLVALTMSPPDPAQTDSGSLDMRVDWTLFDAESNIVALRATTGAHVTRSARLDGAVAAGTAAALAEFIASDSVKAVLPLSSRRPSASWRRPLPNRADTIRLTMADANVDVRGSALEGAVSAVASLRGSTGVGSAFLLSKDGLAITNYHVVRKQKLPLTAKFNDGSSAAVRIVRIDSIADLALLEIECPTDCYTMDLYRGLPALGEEVYAIGTPVSEQFSHSVTKGIVSGVRQRGPERLVQTDAALNRGNSGGPLIEARTARAVGIVSRKLVIDGAEGIGFAIVLDDALRLLGVQRDGSP